MQLASVEGAVDTLIQLMKYVLFITCYLLFIQFKCILGKPLVEQNITVGAGQVIMISRVYHEICSEF